MCRASTSAHTEMGTGPARVGRDDTVQEMGSARVGRDDTVQEMGPARVGRGDTVQEMGPARVGRDDTPDTVGRDDTVGRSITVTVEGRHGRNFKRSSLGNFKELMVEHGRGS